nr:reverse transcriptase domain-containing protein [Tanacetum cinerariifolium]
MNAMANTTPIVTTVTKPAANPRDTDATPRVNIQDFCEEYYEDILTIVMDKSKDCFRSVGESYDNSHPSFGMGINHGYRYRDKDRSHHTKRGRDSKSLLSHVSKSDSIDGGHWKSKSKRHKPTDEDDLTMPWMCEEVDSFTPRIRNFKSLRKTRMPNNVKTYDRTGDPEDQVKNFQTAVQVERWAMHIWCHMFNSTLIGAARVWFDELSPESIDSYKGLKAAFLAYFMQQKKYVKDPVEIHNIKQKDRETVEDFMKRFKTMEEMMITTIPFIRGEAADANKKIRHTSWRTQDQSKRQTLEKRSDFRGKFQPPLPMVTLVEKRSSNKFCDFHNDKGHSTDECIQLKNHIKELVRTGKLWHLIKEIKHGRDQSKIGKKEAPAKDKPTAIYMIQSWQRMTRQKVTQSFERVREIMFPSLVTSSGTKGPIVIEAKIGGHMIHRMYVDGGSSTEALGNNRRRRSFYKSMDEFYDCKLNIGSISGRDIHPFRKRKGARPRNAQRPSKQRYSWQSQMRRKQLFTLAKGCIAIQKCLSASRTLAPRNIGWWTKAFDSQIGEIVSGNDKQFSDNPIKDWCDKLNNTQRFASVKHPQSNGLVERANRSLREGIKARLGKGNKNWVEELSHVLWAHRTMIKSSHGDTPFSLTYGTETVIPAEIGMPTYRTAVVDVVHNDEELRLNLDLLEERHERAAIREAKSKLKMTNHVVDGGKLGPKWEGPYEVTKALGDVAYKLRFTDGMVLPRT